MPIQKIINFIRLINSTIVFAESSSEFIKFHVRIKIRSSEFHPSSELLITENCLPLTDEVIVDLVLKCLQHLYLLALHLEVLGYIPHLLNGLVYLRRIGDFRRDSLFLRLL